MNAASPDQLTDRTHETSPTASARPLRVLHCIPTMSLGGAQRVMIELIRQMQPGGVDPRIAVVGGEETAVDWPSLPVEPTFLNYNGSLRDYRNRRRAVCDLRRILQDEKIDIVHSHLWGAATLVGPVAESQNIPHLVHVHDTRPWIASSRLRDRFHRWWATRTLAASQTRFIAVSRDAWEYNSIPLKLTKRDFDIIPNGVNTDEFVATGTSENAARREGAFRVGVVARFNPEKGHRNIVHAVARLRAADVQVELYLAGTGSLLEETKALAADLGIDDSVHFVGMITDVPRFLNSLDLFVLPSLACEGMPLSILEAMATGLPVIATDVGGTSEVVSHEENGLLIPPDDVTALADSIRSLVDDEDRRRRLARNGQQLVHQHHSWQIAARQIESIYREMVGPS